MKTIAVSIDEPTLARALRHTRAGNAGQGGGRRGARSLSHFVREAVRERLDRIDSEQREQTDRALLSKHRAKLDRQARALIAEQARP